jgi:Mg-chelatase subunit ChlD
VYYFGELDSGIAKSKINKISPVGWIPIADSLEKASDVLMKNSQQNDQNSILSIGNGKETCNGDPIATASKLKNSNKIITNVISFDVTGDIRTQLKNISQSGGGTFYSASSIDEIFEALSKEKEKYWQKFGCESK